MLLSLSLVAVAQPFPWLIVIGWEVLELLITSEGLSRSPFSQMQSSALVTSPSPCAGTASMGLLESQLLGQSEKPNTTDGEKEPHLTQSST